MALIRKDTTVNEIKTKFNNLRSNFLCEHRKINSSFKSGKGTDEIYVPNLYYYEEMKFILDHTVPRNSVDSIPRESASAVELEVIEFETLQDDEYTIIEHQKEAIDPGSVVMDSLASIPVNATAPQPGRKRKWKQSTEDTLAMKAMSDISNALKTETLKIDEPCDKFAQYISQKLKEIKNPIIVANAEEEITKVLLKYYKEYVSSL